ncbi:hypothetical protein [Variovorax gossypii]
MSTAFIELREAPWRADVCDAALPFEVMCRGKLSGVVYWRSNGYGGYLPTPEGRLQPIEGLNAHQLRSEVKRINLEFLAPRAPSNAELA